MKHHLLPLVSVLALGCASKSHDPTSAAVASNLGGLATVRTEDPPVAALPLVAKASAMSADLIELYLPELPYDSANVGNAAKFTITSASDSAYAAGLHPTAVEHRYWPEQARYRPAMLASGGNIAHIEVVYRIYLKLPQALVSGTSYTVTVDPSVVAVPALPLTYGAEASDAIHVNQVAYLSDGPKVAYVSWWTGQGALSLPHDTGFRVVDDATGIAEFRGSARLEHEAAGEVWTRSNIYALDFSALARTGTYHVEVDGVGSSSSFAVAPTAFRSAIGFTVLRGLFMQRDGNAGLDRADLTHFVRPAAHLDDAIDEWSGQRVGLVGGHMDAGDRGHYPHDSAETCANLLVPTLYFGAQIDALGESLELPESGNGIPDYVDELVYELDWLTKAVMNTPRDGTLGFALRPKTFGYEVGVPPTGATDRVFFDKTYGPLRAETLYAAGALAMAFDSPLLQKYLPREKLDLYKQASLRAWNGFELHDGDAAYWKDGVGWYDAWDPTRQNHMWSDELVFAAAGLLEMTGDPKFAARISAELPANLDGLRKWGWVTTGPWLHAFVALTQVGEGKLDPAIKQKARDAIVSWADAEAQVDGTPYDAPFGVPIPYQIRDRVGWYFTNAFASMVALGVTGNATYRDRIVRSWNYLLGTNAQNRSFFSGLGNPNRRPHWLVHEISYWEVSHSLLGDATAWPEIAPGLPMADVQMGEFPYYYDDAWNIARKDKKFPAPGAAYPALYRAIDSWDTGNDFTIERQTRQVASLVPLFLTVAPVAAPPPPAAAPDGGAVAVPSPNLRERAPAPPPSDAARASILDVRWIELYVPEQAVDESKVADATKYAISSTDDPSYALPLHPVRVERRYFPESAPYAPALGGAVPARIRVAYRIHLEAPSDLHEGRTYAITVDGAVLAGSFEVAFSPDRVSEAIHVNQVAYAHDSPKVGYLSWWTGQGAIDFAHVTAFEVVDDATGISAFSGPVHLAVAAAAEPWSRSDVYAFDFTSLTASGKYHVYIPGVGSSYSFGIRPSAYNDVAYTVFRGLTMRRDGDHGLGARDLTAWPRPPAHVDASVDEATNLEADLVGGHILGTYDAHRGHRPWASAHAASSMLSAVGLFPAQVEAIGESLQIRESKNGIPDVLDELMYELDWLTKVVVNGHHDGAVAAELSPRFHARETYFAPTGLPRRTLWSATSGLSRSATLYTAGALAGAAATPSLVHYAPEKCAAYRAAAILAWNAFVLHASDDAYWKDDRADVYRAGASAWTDELLVAAANLLQATGDPAYLGWIRGALPADMNRAMMRWTWVTDGPWLNAWVALATNRSPLLDAAIAARAREAVAAWGDEAIGHDGFDYPRPFGAVMNGHIAMTAESWYTPSATDFAIMLAYGVTANPKYLNQLARDWSYILGTNPLSRTFVSGLGAPARSPRWMVDEIAQYQWSLYSAGDTARGWPEVPAGLPSADIQDGNYALYFDDDWNRARKDRKFPAVDGAYPILFKYSDSWNRGADLGFDQQARGAVSLLPLVSLTPASY